MTIGEIVTKELCDEIKTLRLEVAKHMAAHDQTKAVLEQELAKTVARERDACAKIAESYGDLGIANEIRNRRERRFTREENRDGDC